MTITGFYCVSKEKKEKAGKYTKVGFKVALIVALLTLGAVDPVSSAYTSSTAFKLGNIVNIIK